MPELPEVETICNYLEKNIKNLRIQKIIIRQFSLRWPIDAKLIKVFKDNIISQVYRIAKYLIINCYNEKHNNYKHLLIHLGMSGKLIIVDHDTDYTKHDHLDLILTNGKILRYNDPRRFGSILWTNKNPSEYYLLANLGLDPLDPIFNANYLLKKFINKNLAIKSLLMDPKIVVGIGNIYANEILFAAKIHPLSIAKNLNILQLETLVTSIKYILNKAILSGGTTLRDFTNPAGRPGRFINYLKIYDKSGQHCVACNHEIYQIKFKQRSTFFCQQCQIKI